MKTLEQVKKIESVVLYVLRKFPEGVDYIKLFKIIYFAQKNIWSTMARCYVLIPLRHAPSVRFRHCLTRL